MTRDPRLTLAREDVADAALRGLVEAARFAEPVTMAVAAPVADLRRRPAADAPLDTQALMGERVAVLDIADGWAFGRLETDGYVGYLPSDALCEEGPAPTHRVAGLGAHLYPEPDVKVPPAARLPAPARLAAGETVAGRGLPGGFVPAARLHPLAARVADWVAEAEALLGAPYLWGGRSADGIDCSAILQLALASAGVACPRDSDMQEAKLGRALPAGEPLARGDLVFWRGHIGIMRDPGTLLHANAHHMAVASEPLAEAEARIAAGGGGPVTARKRIDPGRFSA